ncbi:MAG TPA: lysylphosphatidylglycerol synthase transmembrane domain-containing protein [Solirubrobacterales bacterium]|nr:lysylphosphatidylglycerol synthase transmembrane domain-containing protein [Solirubrobacterales bacterium]
MGSDLEAVDRDRLVEEEGETSEPSFFADPKRIAQTLVIVLLLIAAIYVLLPRVVGIQDSLAKLGDATPAWVVVALGFDVLAFFSYVALFRGVVGERIVHLEWRESYQITMAGLAATRLFSAGGAGGIVLTYWALRKAGMERRQTACRMVAFLVLLYAVYMVALVVFGILLRVGVLSGEHPVGLTIVPAALAFTLIVVFLLIALIPDDFERRLDRFAQGYRFARFAHRIATAPATLASGTRTAIDFVRRPSRGGLAVSGAIGFWAANIGILWASFHAYDIHVPLGVVVQGFFVGMVANLIPFAPGGVGAVDAGMIGTFVLFGLPSTEVFAAVLTYRLLAFWLPIPPGIVAFIQLRRTVARWEEDRARQPTAAPTGRFAPEAAITSESKV